MDESECVLIGESSMAEDKDQIRGISNDDPFTGRSEKIQVKQSSRRRPPIVGASPMSLRNNKNLVAHYQKKREEKLSSNDHSYNIPIPLSENVDDMVAYNRKIIEEQSSSSSEEPHPPQPIPPPTTLRVIDVSQTQDLLEIKINKELQRVSQDDESAGNRNHLCIYRIPKNLLASGNTDADAPHFFSLGPYQTQPRFHDMNQHKWRALQQMLKRTGHNVKRCLDPMRELLKRALACYEEPLNLTNLDATTENDNDPFVEMMMLDGCFILEMLQGFSIGFETLGYSEYDHVFSVRGQLFSSIRRDMILLGNQIPLFVLSRLLGIQLGKSDYENSLVAEFAFNFFEPLIPTDPNKSIVFTVAACSSSIGLHLLDELRRSILNGVESQPATRPNLPNELLSTSRQQLVHCVTDLLKAGVTFKKGDDRDKFWDVKFKNGVLTIPRIYIHDATNSLLFNLIVYEQCHLKCSNHITYYTILMDNLINSAHDVSYLRRKGIIEHWLGSDEEVANLFNRLCKEVVFDYSNSYLAALTKDLNVYYGRRRHTWLAILRRRYFDNPWTIISLVAAAVLVLLTAAQTFYTVYAYYNPAN